jgi:hypothetical protein
MFPAFLQTQAETLKIAATQSSLFSFIFGGLELKTIGNFEK